MEEVKSKSTFTLPDEKVIVKFIPRKKGMSAHVSDNHIISGGMLDRSFRRYVAPIQRSGSIANILTNEEKEHLEKLTGSNLSVYDKFWETFYVTLFKEDSNNLFDLSKPLDYISIKILEKYDDEIASSWEERNERSTYMFVITREDEELSEKKKGLDVKKEAFKAYGRIEEDHDKLIGILKLLTNKPVSTKTSLKWVQTKVEEFIDEKPEKFVKLLTDSSLETKLLIDRAIEAGVVVKNSNKYSTSDGLELCNADQIATYDNVVNFLENPKNQEIRFLIEAKLNSEK
jgi:hypothetical protein